MKYEHIESKTLEFKEKLDDYSRLMETITAFVNTQGGLILIGIRDGDREVVGLSREDIFRYHEEIPQVVSDTISPQIAVDLFEQYLGGEVCLAIRVFPGPQKPYFMKREGYPEGVYLRFGSHNRKADAHAVAEFSRMKAGIRYEQTPCPSVSFSDLAPELLEKIFISCNESVFVGTGYGTTDVSGRIISNVAGTLLFYPLHQNIIAESTISLAQYAGTDKSTLIRTEVFSGGIQAMLESSFAFMADVLGTNYQLSGMIKKPVEFALPLAALREALVNAVVHRSYDYESPVRVSLFSDRVEILNPGNFYAPINQENLREGLSRYRNPLIADALRKTGYMEKQGIGISLIIQACLEAGLETPRFVELEHHVKVILYRNTRVVMYAGEEDFVYGYQGLRGFIESHEFFTSSEFAQFLGKSQAMAKKVLQRLQAEGMVKKIGKGPATRYSALH